MRHTLATTAPLLLAVALACGGGEQVASDTEGEAGAPPAAGEAAAPGGGELSTPDWMSLDREAETVTLEIVAGKTDALNGWNFNGYHSGDATIVVPAGFDVTIEFTNQDQVMSHSLGIDERTGNFPATFDQVAPAFAGALTSGATKQKTATQPGESETISFTADEPGQYSMVCYVPAHAVTGMWIHFEVSADGRAGLRTAG